jgi:hypothetical protein
VRNIRSSIRHVPDRHSVNWTGRPTIVTENMWMATWRKLRWCPSLSQQAQADFLYKLCGYRVSRATIGRGLQWTKKAMITKAKEQNRDLRDDWKFRRGQFRAEQIAFVDESEDDSGIAISKKGTLPRAKHRCEWPFHRGERVSFLPYSHGQKGLPLFSANLMFSKGNPRSGGYRSLFELYLRTQRQLFLLISTAESC